MESVIPDIIKKSHNTEMEKMLALQVTGLKKRNEELNTAVGESGRALIKMQKEIGKIKEAVADCAQKLEVAVSYCNTTAVRNIAEYLRELAQ